MSVLNFIKTTLSIVVLLGCLSCEKEPNPLGPCDDNTWAKVKKNGNDACLSEVDILYYNANTDVATIGFTAGNELSGARELKADFAIPVEGLALNTPYPLKEGSIYGADSLTEGSITLLVFDPPAQGKAGCIAGTFELKANGPNAPVPYEYTGGQFIYFKSASQEIVPGAACNPFK